MHTAPAKSNILTLRSCTVDLRTGRIHGESRTDLLHDTELRLLRALVQRTNIPIPRPELYQTVWGRDCGKSRVLDVTMARIRRKLEISPDKPDHLVTEFGVGYRFRTQHVSREPARDAEPFDHFDELSLIGSWFAEGQRLVCIHGPPFSGKTTLARMAMALHGDRHSRARISLDGARNLEAADQRIVDAVQPLLTHRKRFLLVLDDAEYAPAGLLELLQRWMSRIGSLDVLVVGQLPLNEPGSRTLELKSSFRRTHRRVS